MAAKAKLDLDSDNDDNVAGNLSINKDYANRYDNWRRLEELQKIKDRYGDVDEDDESSSEEEPEWTKKDEDSFLKTLGALKSGNVANGKSYWDDEGPSSSKSRESKEKNKGKPMYLKDYERKLVLEKGGDFSESDDEDDSKKAKGYFEEQDEIRKSLKAAIGAEDDDADDLLIKRQKTDDEKAKDDHEFYKWLRDQKNVDDSNELSSLQKAWNDPNIDKDEKFLRDYLCNRDFDVDDNEHLPTYDDIVGLEEDEEDLDKQRNYEQKYNFRFEDPDQDFIKQYPRSVSESLRQSSTKRKEKRDEYKDRKAREKEERKQELKQLKKMKRAEIEHKLERLKRIAGDEITVNMEDLNADFDPKEYDKRMQELFSKDYYGQEGDEDEEKPVFSDSGDESDGSNYDELDVTTMNRAKSSGNAEENEQEEDLDESEGQRGRQKKDSRRRKKRNRKFLEAVMREKPLFDPSEKTFEEYFNEYYALEYEDIIGDQTTRFKYRQVVPNNFGLDVNEILEADDRQLNAWCSLKKATSYRSEQEEMYDVQAYKKKSQNRERKQKIFTTDFSRKPAESKNPSTDKQEKKNKKKKRKHEEPNELEVKEDAVSEKIEKPIEETTAEPSAKKARRRKKKSHQNADTAAPEPEVKASEETVQENGHKKKHKHKKAESAAASISDDRLKAYGINPKKYKSKLKYGKKKEL